MEAATGQIVFHGSQAKRKETGENGKQGEKTQESHLVQHRQVGIVRAGIIVPNFKVKQISESFAGRRVFLKAPPSLFPGSEPELPVRVVIGVKNSSCQFLSDAR